MPGPTSKFVILAENEVYQNHPSTHYVEIGLF
jgi:hypothetical protein